MRDVAVHIVKSAPAVISQQKLDLLKAYENQIRTLTRMYNEEAAAVLQLLLSGSLVEPGTHLAEIAETREGGRRISRLVIY